MSFTAPSEKFLISMRWWPKLNEGTEQNLRNFAFDIRSEKNVDIHEMVAKAIKHYDKMKVLNRIWETLHLPWEVKKNEYVHFTV